MCIHNHHPRLAAVIAGAIAMASALFGEMAAASTNYAVCVGINQYSTAYIRQDQWLSGCVPDARHICTNITERGEWKPENVTLLLNSGAKKTSIRSAITRVAAKAVPGDVFLYYHSSHGGNTSSANDSLDVFLCTYNANYTDAELAADLAKFQSGVKVVVMVDACNSGGLFKSLDGDEDAISTTGARGSATLTDLQDPPERSGSSRAIDNDAVATSFGLAGRVSAAIDAIRAGESRRRGAARGIDSSEIGWITAADYNQYSWDNDAGTGGVFTDAALAGWTYGYCDDRDYGDEDCYADFYELWNFAKDFATGKAQSGEDHTDAQCANADVLRSVRAGWVGDRETATDDPPRFRPIGTIEPDVGQLVSGYVRVYTPTNATAMVSIVSGHPSATLVDGVFSFTPPAVDDYEFTLAATNANGSTNMTFTVSSYPVMPENLHVTNVASNSFTACWSPAAGAEWYKLGVVVGRQSDWSSSYKSYAVFGDYVGNVTNYVISDLKPDTYYTFWVWACSGDKNSYVSSRKTVRTDKIHSRPSWSGIPVQTGQVGRPFVLDLARFIDGHPASGLTLTEGSATLAGTVLSFTPSATGTYPFTVVVSNDVGSAETSFSVEAGPPTSKRFALCVGINKYEVINGLDGCVNDAEFMAANLMERGGLDTADVTILTDAAATKSAIRGAISNIVAQSMAGDTFIYQHSSHGGQFYDETGELIYGEDGKATFICVYDEDYYDNATAYNDYEIAEDLAAFPAGVKVAVIVDACHSAGLFKSRDEARAAAASFDLAGRVSSLIDAGRARRRALGEDVARTISASEIGWATAAEYYEYSMDGGFYHTDEWLTNDDYGWGYLVQVDQNNGYFDYPSFYRIGGVFLTSATWGWWNGDADTDVAAGDNDGLCDVYELWKKGHDFCTAFGTYWYWDSDYNYNPQCTNVTVLRSIELGRAGGGPSPRSIALMLTGAGDAGLAANITNAAVYSAYLDWITTVKGSDGTTAAGEKAVWASPYSWLSFALGSDTLMTNSLTSADVTITSFAPAGDDGAFALEVEIAPLAIGSGVADQAVLLSNLAQIIGIEGATSLATDNFSSDGIGVTFSSPDNGRIRLLATPPADAGDSFFMRVKVR